MAEAADAARERVLAARAQLDEELVVLEASARAAIDIPAKVKASPVKAAAVVGTVGFVALKGPKRVAGRIKRAVRGPNAPLPKRMLPDEIEKTLGLLGTDGDAVRGALERDFAAYAKQSAKSRGNLKNLIILAARSTAPGRGGRRPRRPGSSRRATRRVSASAWPRSALDARWCAPPVAGTTPSSPPADGDDRERPGA